MIKFINHTNNSYTNDMKLNYCKNIISRDLLPHLGDSIMKKLYFMGLMINKLIKCYLGILEPSNRDAYNNKRMECAGVLMANLTSQCIVNRLN